jgi:ribose transport system substrate-binding protein
MPRMLRRYRAYLGALLALLACHCLAEGKTRIAVVGKDQSQFFTQVQLGCSKAETELKATACEFHAPLFADVVAQDKLIQELIENGVDGIAVSILHSKFLADNSLTRAKAAGIPVVTFDSDLDEHTLSQQPDLRHAYVGTDNFAFGQAFAAELMKRYPDGAVICLQSGRPDSPNLRQRMLGLRVGLSGKTYKRAPGHRLTGENSWFEHSRCPLYSYEDPRVALRQMAFILKRDMDDIDAFVSLGAWSQYYPHEYRHIVRPMIKEIEQNKVSLIVADTLFFQIELLNERLANVNIGQSPFEMGRLSVHTLVKILRNEEVPEHHYTPIQTCLPGDEADCKALALH